MIVNCSASGSKTLCNDDKMYQIRGHLIRVSTLLAFMGIYAWPINWSVTLNFILRSQQLIRQGNPFANDKEAMNKANLFRCRYFR